MKELTKESCFKFSLDEGKQTKYFDEDSLIRCSTIHGHPIRIAILSPQISFGLRNHFNVGIAAVVLAVSYMQ